MASKAKEKAEVTKNKNEETKTKEVSVSEQVMLQLTIMEFDKNIASAEATVYELKRKRADYIYTTNMNAVVKNSSK